MQHNFESMRNKWRHDSQASEPRIVIKQAFVEGRLKAAKHLARYR